MTLLELRGLSKAFGDVAAVSGVDLSLTDASRTAIVGPSGCGKTTLLRLIAGFEAPDAGRITFDGALLADAAGARPAHLRGVGLVAQDGALFPHLSVADNVGFGVPRAEPGRAARIGELLDLVGLARTTLTRQPHELSGGQQQRVALARAMARRPRLMLLDEPFSALDTSLRAAMRAAVIDLLDAARIAAILVTHDQAEALSFGTRIAVMHAGTLSQVGPPRDLYRWPRDRRIAEFLGEAVILPARIAQDVALCALGAIPVTGAGGRDRALIMLRPEQVRLVPCPDPRAVSGAAPGTPPAPMGEVTGVDFGGATSSVTLRLAPGALAGTGDAGVLTLRQTSATALDMGDTVRFETTGTAHVLDDPCD